MIVSIKAGSLACLFFILSFSSTTFGKVITDDHYKIKETIYSWQDVCRKLTKRTSPLIEYKSISQLDCMGDIVDVIKFCDEQEITNPYLTRALVKKDKTIRCVSGKRVVIKWECEGKEDKYCKDPDIGCFLFKEKLARRLKLIHQSVTDKKHLNCYFDIKREELNLNI